MTVREFIEKNYAGNQREFARAHKIAPALVSQWIRKKFIVVDENNMYSFRKTLTTKNEE
jgi:DNA-binding transcriptional regulator YdaS (Cro superfamily)